MDIYVWISVLSVMYSWISSTVLSAPAGDALTASTVKEGRHVRTKRCSCASFQDKECVYFCHLDIIWVNTPERVVSYGLGNAPRTRRALADSSAPRSVARCQCVRENDNTCLNFCRPENRLRSPQGESMGGRERGLLKKTAFLCTVIQRQEGALNLL
uniref:Endothelin-1 n=1 Tax=Pundamilia nyererei TaxID=303518 RepID=A0A3B4F1N5_9CICH